jgi:hypothetical protein
MFDKRSSDFISIIGKRNESLPMQLRESLKRKIQMYDKFKLSKGISKNADVTLADCISLLRPKPKNKEFEAFYKSIQDGSVVVGDGKAQIKTELTKKGQTKTQDNSGLVKAVSTDILQNVVKNLVSLYGKGVFNDKEAVDSVCKKLRDPKEVKNSRLLPFRFYSAYKEVDTLRTDETTRKLKDALIDALDLAVENAETVEGVTAILVDLSGSMNCNISGNSVLKADEVSAVLAAIAYKSGTADLFGFSTNCKKVDISRKSPVMDIAKAILGSMSQGGTDLNQALSTIEVHSNNTKTKYDSLLLLSDNDCYGYDTNKNTLTFEDRGYFGGRSTSADTHMNELIKKGIFRKVWINNLLGNEFAIFNTESSTKNLITGFNEQFLNMISVYNTLGNNKDIRKVIDMMLEKVKGKKK